MNDAFIKELTVSETYLEETLAREMAEARRREERFRSGRGVSSVKDRIVLLVDDGLATGATMRAAVCSVRSSHPAKLVVAVPVGSSEACSALRTEVDELVCLDEPEPFYAVGLYYLKFEPVEDSEVQKILEEAHARKNERSAHLSKPLPTSVIPPSVEHQEHLVKVETGGVTLEGSLAVPDGAHGVVLFAHGSGSSRHSPRNQYVAQALQEGGLATLLIDLLTTDEEVIDQRTGHLRFDIRLLAGRLIGAAEWLAHDARTDRLRIGYFGASTGGGAALVAAADRPELVSAVVSRGGRPDLAAAALPRVEAPTLLIVGGSDSLVLDLNRTALAQLRTTRKLQVVPGATHLFEEPGAMAQVASLARDWFRRYLTQPTG